MSDIRDMNRDIRWRTTSAGAGFFALTAVAVAPEAVVDLLSEGEADTKLAWSLLVAVAAVLVVLLEGTDFGRDTRHRGRVNREIATSIIRGICPRSDCRETTDPNPAIRASAMGIFYSRIDVPSREVAFHQWGWYYTTIYWTALASFAFAFALTYVWFSPTEELLLRWGAIALLALAASGSWLLAGVWRDKTATHARMQVAQIAPTLPSSLPNVTCRHPTCPST